MAPKRPCAASPRRSFEETPRGVWGPFTTPQHRRPTNGRIRRGQRGSVLLLLCQNADRGNFIAEGLVHVVDL